MTRGSRWAYGIRQVVPGVGHGLPHVPGPKPSGQTRALTLWTGSEEPFLQVTFRQPKRPGGEPWPLMPKHLRPIPYTISLAGHLQGPSSATRGRRQKGVEGHIREILRLFRSRPHRGAIFSGNAYITSNLEDPKISPEGNAPLDARSIESDPDNMDRRTQYVPGKTT